MDGDDLSKYDEIDKKRIDDQDDTEALDQLEWELASQGGRVTGEMFLTNLFRCCVIIYRLRASEILLPDASCAEFCEKWVKKR